MSKVAIKGATTGTGTFTIESPATNTDRTLVLPDNAGTLDTLQRAGNVLQVVSATYDVTVSTSSQTLVDTGLSATITPTSATSKILVFIHQNGAQKQPDNSSSDIEVVLLRGTTQINKITAFSGFTNTTLNLYLTTISTAFLDSPATASPVTYKTQFRNPDAAAAIRLQTGNSVSTITLMEIAA
jgi:hypothetical protein